MKSKMLRMTLVFLLIIPGVRLFSQDTYLLKYNFEKGKSFVQNTRITQNMVQSMGGQEIKFITELNASTSLLVEHVEDDGKATILFSTGNISMHSIAMGRDTTLTYKDLKDKVRITLDNTGKSLSTEKVDSSDIAAIVNQIDIGKLRFIPGKTVKIGEKWQDHAVNIRQPSSGNPFTVEVGSDTEYTLEGKETVNGKELLKVTYTGNMSISGKGTQMGMDMVLEGTGKNEGFSYYDPGVNLIISTEETAEMEINVAVSGPSSMTIPMTQSVKSVITLEERK